ncbi:MAG TPA: thiamine pyrophosphate-dependent enzyme [Acidimicrobiales bacterium]|nr:thiamine pyrophosphate-dependent enzyme [Acidimicrobiales bacterium]
MTEANVQFVDTSRPPDEPSRRIADFKPDLLDTEDHHLCPGCGHPVAWRLLLEVIEELSLEQRAIGVVGHGCYTHIIQTADLDFLQCLHGRAPSAATGVKRVHGDAAVFTLQGDGDLVNEGLQETLHTAARGERITSIMLNNGVFGDTGGHMTSTTVVGQRTKTSIDGRDPAMHGYPIPVADLLCHLDGAAYVARGAVNNAASVARTKKMLKRAFEFQMAGAGFTFLEILTMCPTGWFVPAKDGGDYLASSMEEVYPLGELKAP